MKSSRSVNDEVLSFVCFLNSSWSSIGPFFKLGEVNDINDWFQGNWELLLEGALQDKLGSPVRLEVYGEGADANGASSRVLFPEDTATHVISFKIKDTTYDVLNKRTISDESDHEIEQFVAFREGWHYPEGTFEYILCIIDGSESVVPIKDVNFYMSKIVNKE